jgi:DNA-binding HxlR family transcriptional regulator
MLYGDGDVERSELSDEERNYLKSIATVFSQKWTFDIIYALSSCNGDSGFNELIKNLDGISAAVLSSRLKILQKWGYVKREVRTGPPTRTRYALSEKGRSLLKIADFVLQHRGKTTFEPEMLSAVHL